MRKRYLLVLSVIMLSVAGCSNGSHEAATEPEENLDTPTEQQSEKQPEPESVQEKAETACLFSARGKYRCNPSNHEFHGRAGRDGKKKLTTYLIDGGQEEELLMKCINLCQIR